MHDDRRMGALRISIAVALAIVLIILAVTLYAKNHHAQAPAKSTFQTQPNNSKSTPSSGSVTNGGDQSQDTVPSSSGTGSNAQVSQ
jgi:negative regulator of sigma E activity